MESYAYFLVILTRNWHLYFILMALSKPSEVTASLNESTTTDFQTESYGSFLTLYKWLLRKKKKTQQPFWQLKYTVIILHQHV